MKMSRIHKTLFCKVKVNGISSGIKALIVCQLKSSFIVGVTISLNDGKSFLLVNLKLIALVNSQ